MSTPMCVHVNTLCVHERFYSGKALELDSDSKKKAKKEGAGGVAQQSRAHWTGFSAPAQGTPQLSVAPAPRDPSLHRDTHVHTSYRLTHVRAIRNQMLKSWRQWNPDHDQNKMRNAEVAGWVLVFLFNPCSENAFTYTQVHVQPFSDY